LTAEGEARSVAIPTALAGDWRHAVILSYGLDLTFYEHCLASQLPGRCRNRIVLGDGDQFLLSMAVHERTVRYANRSYLVDGIFAPHSAHAKLILLANEVEGRLLVGSGNLDMRGYASGGELFTQYEWRDEATAHGDAFAVAAEFVDFVVQAGYVGEATARHWRILREETQWLNGVDAGESPRLRHSFRESFVAQLIGVVDGAPVEELWVLSPFYDDRCQALDDLLDGLAPGDVTLLVQEGRTSVDPEALERVAKRHPDCAFSVRPARKRGSDPYLHAKAYLVKLQDRAICLSGSPNLGQRAMTQVGTAANLELASLVEAGRSDFDGMLEELEIGPPAKSLGDLRLELRDDHPGDEHLPEGWSILRGEIAGSDLVLEVSGDPPGWAELEVEIARKRFAPNSVERDGHSLRIELPEGASGLVNAGAPIRLICGQPEDAAASSNTIYVVNRTALETILARVDDSKTLERVGALELDDEEFEELLRALDRALTFDAKGMWRLSGESSTNDSGDDEEEITLSYDQIDYDEIRRHPRIQQYAASRAFGRGAGYAGSPLQIILDSISAHFRGLFDPEHPAQAGSDDEGAGIEPEPETEEEAERDAEVKDARRWSSAARRRVLLRNFIRRYLRGLRSDDFRELAGFSVMSQNFFIFSHVIWRLLHHNWVEDEFLMETAVDLNRGFWGGGGKPGYVQGLDEAEREALQEWLREEHADSLALALITEVAGFVRPEDPDDADRSVRDYVRAFLNDPPFLIGPQTLAETRRMLNPFEPPSAAETVEALARAAGAESSAERKAGIASVLGVDEARCHFEAVLLRLGGVQRRVRCLFVEDDALVKPEVARAAISRWMRSETLDFYRVAARPAIWHCQYAPGVGSGMFLARDRRVELASISRDEGPWSVGIDRLNEVASEADELAIAVPAAESA
jgi:hypothetical protein